MIIPGCAEDSLRKVLRFKRKCHYESRITHKPRSKRALDSRPYGAQGARLFFPQFVFRLLRLCMSFADKSLDSASIVVIAIHKIPRSSLHHFGRRCIAQKTILLQWIKFSHQSANPQSLTGTCGLHNPCITIYYARIRPAYLSGNYKSWGGKTTLGMQLRNVTYIVRFFVSIPKYNRNTILHCALYIDPYHG